jgi:hypothetical protein
MGVQTILERARTLGVTLWVAGDRIRYSPKSQAPSEFVDLLREHKAELLAYLSGEPPPAALIETAQLLSWASALSEQELVLAAPVSYTEAPMRTMTTEKVSRHAGIYLRAILLSRTYQRSGSWHPWTTEWWQKQEQTALGSLAALRTAMDHQEGGQDSHD